MRNDLMTVGGRYPRLRNAATRFWRDESGATVVEYGSIAGLISIAILFTLAAIGTSMRDGIFEKVSTAVSAALASSGS